jgi:hypothetical protein
VRFPRDECYRRVQGLILYLKVSRDGPEGNFWKKKKEKNGQSMLIAMMEL